jgi:hypothetical protein
MLHTLHFSLQNAVYFIMLTFLVHALFTFYIQDVLKFKCKTRVPKGKTDENAGYPAPYTYSCSPVQNIPSIPRARMFIAVFTTAHTGYSFTLCR